jgi:FlxA-like protein
MPSTALPSTKKTEPASSRDAEPRLGAVEAWLARVRGGEFLTGLRVPARPTLLILAIVLFTGLYIILSVRGHKPRPAGFVLRAEHSYLNLKNTSAVKPKSEVANRNSVVRAASPRLLVPPPVSAPAHPLSHPEATVRIGALPAFPRSDLLVPVAAVEPVRENCYQPRERHQGDTLMMRAWKSVGLRTILAALLAAAPSVAKETSGPPTDSEKIENLQKQLNAVKKTLDQIKAAVDTLPDAQADAKAAFKTMETQVQSLRDQVTQLRSELSALRTVPPAATRQSLSPPADSIPALTPPMARVELVNTFLAEETVVVNRRTYRVAPGEVRLSDPIPAGPFSYEVLGVTPPRERTVGAGQVYTVHIHP